MAITCTWSNSQFTFTWISISGFCYSDNNMTYDNNMTTVLFLQTYIPSEGHSPSLTIQLASISDMATNTENQIQTSVEDLNLFDIFLPVLSHLDMLWELVITAEPLVIMASSPTLCSAMVLALTRQNIQYFLE